MEVGLNIDDAWMHQLQTNIGGDIRPFEVVSAALTMYGWAVNEVSIGRAILSANHETGEEMQRLVMPALETIKKCNARL